MIGIRSVSAATLLALAACGGNGVGIETAQPAPLPSASFIPAGTVMSVRLNEDLSTNTRIGERFTATVIEPLVTTGGQVVVPAGSYIGGVVTGVDPSTRRGDVAAIRVDIDRLQIGNQVHPFSAEVIDTDPVLSRDEADLLEGAGIGAAAGAVLGAIVTGGDLEGILVGGALGAGAGTIIALGTGDMDPELDRGSVLTLRTTQAVDLR